MARIYTQWSKVDLPRLRPSCPRRLTRARAFFVRTSSIHCASKIDSNSYFCQNIILSSCFLCVNVPGWEQSGARIPIIRSHYTNFKNILQQISDILYQVFIQICVEYFFFLVVSHASIRSDITVIVSAAMGRSIGTHALQNQRCCFVMILAPNSICKQSNVVITIVYQSNLQVSVFFPSRKKNIIDGLLRPIL